MHNLLIKNAFWFAWKQRQREATSWLTSATCIGGTTIVSAWLIYSINSAAVIRQREPFKSSQYYLAESPVSCQSQPSNDSSSKSSAADEDIVLKKIPDQFSVPRRANKLKKWIYRCTGGFLGSLPLPRRLSSRDPELVLSPKIVRQRKTDANHVQSLQQQMATIVSSASEVDSSSKDARMLTIAKLVQELYELLYGKGATPHARQEFLIKYGCTAWTREMLKAIVEIGKNRGIVEIGAGHGQWAKALADAYSQYHQDGDGSSDRPDSLATGRYDWVLAYDDFSQLPLNNKTNMTFPVNQCNSELDCLRQWTARGRVLLLVYPPPESDMAVNAVRIYEEQSIISNKNSSGGEANGPDENLPTVVYVGEGRGGANANDAFFDLMESGCWVLETVLPGKPFGNKGYENLYIFRNAST